MDGNPPLIRLEKIRFAYPGGEPVLKGLSFELKGGERVGLIGPNGSGKTTMFHVIMGLLRPDSGHVEVFGRQRRNESDFREVRQRVGLLFQDPDDQLFSPTVLEDVAFGPLNQGRSIAEAKEIARETLVSLGLGELENRVTYRLSGGEKKLVSLATVLAMKPNALLLDEPTSGLDPDTVERLVHILGHLEIPYVFISHDMDFIDQTTDKVYGMLDGCILPEDEIAPHTHHHSHGFGRLPHRHHNIHDIRQGVKKEK